MCVCWGGGEEGGVAVNSTFVFLPTCLSSFPPCLLLILFCICTTPVYFGCGVPYSFRSDITCDNNRASVTSHFLTLHVVRKTKQQRSSYQHKTELFMETNLFLPRSTGETNLSSLSTWHRSAVILWCFSRARNVLKETQASAQGR